MTAAAEMGPLVTAAHRDKVSSYIDAGAAAGAELVVDGRGLKLQGYDQGFWLGGTLLDRVTPDNERLQGRDLRAGAVGGPRRRITKTRLG